MSAVGRKGGAQSTYAVAVAPDCRLQTTDSIFLRTFPNAAALSCEPMPDTNRKPPSPNQQRIMDVLLEDALKAPAPLPATAGRRLAPRPRRKVWASVAVTVACLVVVALALGYVLTRPPAAPTNSPIVASNTLVITPRVEPRPRPDTGNQAGPQPQPEPMPQPEPGPSPDPKPQPQPEPQPQPIKPPEQVENPPQPQPTPEPVEPKPVQPDKETVPVVRPTKGFEVTLLSAEKGAELRVANAEFAEGHRVPAYRQPKDEAEFADASWFHCRKPVDLVVRGVLLRLQGELRIEIYRGGAVLLLEHTDGDLFVDSRGAKHAVDLSHKQIHGTGALWMSSGRALFGTSDFATDVTVYEGEVKNDDLAVPAGKRVTIRRGKASDLRDLRRPQAEEPFLKGLADRSVYREDFDKPNGRLREGVVEGGILKGAEVFWGYPENIKYQPGMVLRMRLHLKAGKHTITQFCPERDDNFSVEIDALEGWQVIEVPLNLLRDRRTHSAEMKAGDSFMNISIGSQVQVDWIEILKPHR